MYALNRHLRALTLPRWWPVAAILGFAVLASPEHAWGAVLFALYSLVAISPVILVGLALAAAASASGATSLIARAVGGRPLLGIAGASVIGALTPVCGITVLPLVAGFLAGGVALAPIMAFWLASPITGPGMLAITAGTLGWEFAVGKTLAAVGIGLFGGLAIWLLGAQRAFAQPVKPSVALSDFTGQCAAAFPPGFVWRFWRDATRREAFFSAAVGTGRLMIVWLGAAFVAEYFLHLWLPPDLLAPYVGAESAWAVPLAAVVGAPIYLDGYAALPLLRGLMDNGMADGPAMAFLIAGGIISAWAAIPVYALVRLPVFLTYLGLAVSGAMLAGWAFAAAVS